MMISALKENYTELLMIICFIIGILWFNNLKKHRKTFKPVDLRGNVLDPLQEDNFWKCETNF